MLAKRKMLKNQEKWKEFRNSGLLWFINTILHTFGWAIVFEINKESNSIINVYPSRVKFKGFNEKSNDEGYIKVTKYLKENVNELYKEIND